jgi:L-amino acid N-acyltransferase
MRNAGAAGAFSSVASGPMSTAPAPPPTGITIRDAGEDDLVTILALNNLLIPVDATAWTEHLETIDARREWFAHKQADGWPVLVADLGGAVVGFATYGEFRDNAKWEGYRFTAELTIHVDPSQHGTGVGRRLMEALVDRARAQGLHTLVAAVDGENEGSIRFHERLGFVETARMPQVGFKFGRWLDLVLLQRVVDG